LLLLLGDGIKLRLELFQPQPAQGTLPRLSGQTIPQTRLGRSQSIDFLVDPLSQALGPVLYHSAGQRGHAGA
jgi:hypothetical protein